MLSTKESIEAAFLYLHGVDLSKKNWDFDDFLKREEKNRERILDYIKSRKCPWGACYSQF